MNTCTFASLAVFTLLVSACSEPAQKPDAKPPEPTGPPRTCGFLMDYSNMTPGKKHPEHWIWEKPGVDMRVYHRLLIDPVAVMPVEDSKAGELDPADLEKAAKVFREILIGRVDPYYTVVEEKAPDVLRVRIALSDLVPERPAQGGKPAQTGEAMIEVEMLDSVSGEALATGVLCIKGSLAGSGEVKREWRHVEGAFIEWANGLLDYMDRKHE